MPLVSEVGVAGTVLGNFEHWGQKLRKLDVLEYMYYIISDCPLTDYIFLEVFQNTSFTRTIKSTTVRGALESVELSGGCSL